MSTVVNTVFSQNRIFTHISDKQLNRILKSNSLKKTQFMSLIDKLFDRFFRNPQNAKQF